jgi:hypothetical protein
MHTKFHEGWFWHYKVNGRDTHTDTHRREGDFMILLLFFQNKERRLIRTVIIITHSSEHQVRAGPISDRVPLRP